MGFLADLSAFRRYAAGLSRFLEQPLSAQDCLDGIRERLRAREDNLLLIFEHGIYAQQHSPFRALLVHAGVELGDVARLIRSHGVEETLSRLYDEGAYVTYEEFKGLRPIERPGLSLSVTPTDFDNPLFLPDYLAANTGSSGVTRRVRLDFDVLTLNAAYNSLIVDSLDARDRPFAMWLPVPPSLLGLVNVLRSLKLRTKIDRWFSPNPLDPHAGSVKDYLLGKYTIHACRRYGMPFPSPEHVPLGDAHIVAEWLAEQTSAGSPALVSAGPPSAGVRICLAADDRGLDISGTTFHFQGEPYTASKASVVAAAGCRASSSYSSVELNVMAVGCPAAEPPDEAHVASDRLAVLQRRRPVGLNGATVGALLFTTLHPACPKLTLNVETDDYAVLTKRDCGCPVERLGLDQHLHTIRSHAKLTSGGTTFLGGELHTLMEQTLPARFGGSPTDYQLVEEEHEGLPTVAVVVSPRVGDVDEQAVVATVLEDLRTGPAYRRMMAGFWSDGEMLRVERREPHSTQISKILPLHLLRN
jgi:hypothetical protein